MPPKVAKMGEKTNGDGAISKADLLAALAENKDALLTELNASINKLHEKLDGFQDSLDDHEVRLSSLEEGAVSVDHRLDKLETTCAKLRDANDKLHAKVVDLEGRSRRSNIRIIGLDEGIEGPQPSLFFAQMLQKVFGPNVFPSPPELDRAHRGPGPRPGPGGKPRQVIICFHRFHNKERAIREARIKKQLNYEGHTFRLYEDYSPEVVSQRKEYSSVMSSLYSMGLKPALLYPARLRITQADGKRTWFSSVA